MKNLKRWLPLSLIIAGTIVPLFLIVVGFSYGVWVENRTSGDGPNNIIWAGFLLLPLLQLSALISGIWAWRRIEGKMGIVAALAVLLLYAGYWLRWWF